MTTIKSYTDINQSKRLAEILPLESADMRYGYIAPYDYSDRMYDGGYDEVPYPKDFLMKNPNFSIDEYEAELPCWSLSALLSVLIYPHIEQNYMGQWICRVEQQDTTYLWEDSNPVDACVAMIEQLYKLNLL